MNSSSPHSSKPALRWLFQRARTARLWIALSVSLGFGSGLLLIAQAALIAHLLQAVFIEALPRSELTRSFVLFAMVVAGRAFMAWAREIAGFQAGARVRIDVRRNLLAHMTAAGPALTRQQQTGALASTVVEQVEALHNFFAHYLPQLGLAVLIPVSIVAVVFPVSWTAGAILAGTAPLIPLFMVLIGMGAESISQRQFQALSRMSGHFLDVLQGLPTLKIFLRSKAEAERVAKVSRDYRLRTMRVLRIAFLSSAVLEFFSSVSIALVAVYLGTHFLGYIEFGTYGNPLTLGTGLFILVLAPDFYLPLRELGTHYHARAEAAGAAEEIMRILDTPLPAQATAMHSVRVTKPIGIVFDNVSFTYANRAPYLLQNVSFTVRAGQKMTLAGASGGGKSTLLNLLMGFEQPSQGTIAINGMLLSGISHQDWRKQLAWVGQQPVLFYGSLRDNIRLGRPEADEPAIRAAARAAKVLEFSDRMPKGLDTHVGEKGQRLSRGQAQRVALARAFLADAPLLLLDEPTAGLDAANERLVVEAIDRLSHGRTVIMVTHRMANVRDNDRILTLANGRIAEDGCYRDLMAARGALFNLLRSPGEARDHD
jgi:ATP-binding cassette, subfamily C, bacterial CydD